MKNFFRFIFVISVGGSIVSLIVSICNYLIARQITGEQIMRAYSYNMYVHFWVNLTAFFIGTTVCAFVGFLFTRSQQEEVGYVDQGMQVYEDPSTYGTVPVDEYVTVRMKKDDLAKLQ